MGAYGTLAVDTKWQGHNSLLICYEESFRDNDNEGIRRVSQYRGIAISYVVGTGSPWPCDE